MAVKEFPDLSETEFELPREIEVHRRTPTAGHLTGVLSYAEAANFADQELALGRAVILEIGSESTLIRSGQEALAFIKRVLGIKTEPKPVMTTISPMAGGQEDAAPPAYMPPSPSQPESGAQQDFRDEDEPLERARGNAPGRHRIPPEVEFKAWRGLVERIGQRQARGLLAGGGYAVRSQLWPTVLYVVTPDEIKVIDRGRQMSRICIVATDNSSIWDTVLARIQLLESGPDGEVQVYATGQIQNRG